MHDGPHGRQWRQCLPIWTTFGSALQIGKHTTFTWKHFFRPGCQWACHQFGKTCFCRSNFGNSRAHNFGSGFGPYGRAHHLNRLLSRPSGYQTVAKICRHGELLQLFSSWSCPHFAAFDSSPEGQPKNATVDRCGREGFSRCKAPPHQSGVTSPQAKLL